MGLRFYDVDNEYTDYLRVFEPKIPHITYSSHDKFICGIVLEVNSFKYYAPISSFKQRQFTNLPIIHNNRIIGTVRFSYMFPCPDFVLTEKDFSIEPDFNYRNLLQDEWNYCNGIEHELKAKARYIYKRYLSGQDTVLLKHCCDFPLLEGKMKEYAL